MNANIRTYIDIHHIKRHTKRSTTETAKGTSHNFGAARHILKMHQRHTAPYNHKRARQHQHVSALCVCTRMVSVCVHDCKCDACSLSINADLKPTRGSPLSWGSRNARHALGALWTTPVYQQFFRESCRDSRDVHVEQRNMHVYAHTIHQSTSARACIWQIFSSWIQLCNSQIHQDLHAEHRHTVCMCVCERVCFCQTG